ncbi:furin-like protease kpc-1 [Glandiceps talaboti]
MRLLKLLRYHCIIVSLIVVLGLNVVRCIHYTNDWALHIVGGKEEADRLAYKYGFVNLQEIIDDHYHFKDRRVHKRSLQATTKPHHVLLQKEPSVKWTEQQVARRRVKRDVNTNFNDPKWPMWYLKRDNGQDMNIEEAWKKGYSGRGVVVSILDDGIERDHPDLRQNYDQAASVDKNGNDDDPTPRYTLHNENRHGTRCAGVVAAVGGNRICGVGAAFNAKIGGVRMLDGGVTDAIEASSLSFNPQHIDIYSSGWGPDDDGKTVEGPARLTRQALILGVTQGRGGRGSIFVWASGNGGQQQDSCNCDGYTNSIYTLSISSTTEHGAIPWYSENCSSTLATTYSSGDWEDKGVITTDLRRGCTDSHSGTSASTSLAAGICALALEANQNLTWRDMQHIVVLTSRPKNLQASDWTENGAGYKVSHSYGFGLMDATAIVEYAETWVSVPEQNICEENGMSKAMVNIPSNGLTLTKTTTGCENSTNHVLYLEHVQATLTLSIQVRGNLEIYLTSPSGTRSVLLPQRRRDQDRRDGFKSWPFMTTHCWGERATGTWTLEIMNKGGRFNTGMLKEWKLVLHGTSQDPLHQYRGVNESGARPTLQCPMGFYKCRQDTSNGTLDYHCLPCHSTCRTCSRAGPNYCLNEQPPSAKRDTVYNSNNMPSVTRSHIDIPPCQPVSSTSEQTSTTVLMQGHTTEQPQPPIEVPSLLNQTLENDMSVNHSSIEENVDDSISRSTTLGTCMKVVRDLRVRLLTLEQNNWEIKQENDYLRDRVTELESVTEDHD